MRIATMTNWAYGITVCLTITSGIAMLMASNAETAERQAVQQRQIFDQLTETVETESWELSDLARCVAGVPPAGPFADDHRAAAGKAERSGSDAAGADVAARGAADRG